MMFIIKNITVATMPDRLREERVPITLIFMTHYKGLCAYLCNEMRKEGG